MHVLPYPLLMRHGLLALAFNTALATVINAWGHQGFWHDMLYSQLIGLTIWALIDFGRFALFAPGVVASRPWQTLTPLVLAAVLVGYFGGSATSDWLLGRPPLAAMQQYPKSMVGFFLMSLIAGIAGTYYFLSREQIASARLAQEAAQRQATQAQLMLLQSQLEPHMLFNTLANLRALIGTNPQAATAMLDRLNDYLRATLAASRAPTHSLAKEFERLRDYLELMGVRMGERLHYTLDLPPALREQNIPSLLLQPLVENAIVHGLEPKLEGGQLWVSAAQTGTRLLLTVQDNGLGLRRAAPNPAGGFGLAQVRERLHNTYGADAIFSIASYAANTRATIEIDLKNAAKPS